MVVNTLFFQLVTLTNFFEIIKKGTLLIFEYFCNGI